MAQNLPGYPADDVAAALTNMRKALEMGPIAVALLEQALETNDPAKIMEARRMARAVAGAAEESVRRVDSAARRVSSTLAAAS